MEQVKNVVGFMPDGYALVNLSAFVEAVDLLGGLDFDVPMDHGLRRSRPEPFHPSESRRAAPDRRAAHVGRAFPLGIRQCRHRPHGGAARGDEDRHEAVAAAENARCAAGLWRIYQENLTTDLSVRNIVWMARVLLKGMSGDIEANVLPGYATMAGDASVYMIDTYAASALLPDYSPYK